jgi:hypothetical protein
MIGNDGDTADERDDRRRRLSRAHSTEAGCKNLGRLLFIYVDGGGRPFS